MSSLRESIEGLVAKIRPKETAANKARDKYLLTCRHEDFKKWLKAHDVWMRERGSP